MSDEEIELLRIYIDGVDLQGFKSIKHLSVDFQRNLNILIGKNGSGKSNFMELLFHAISFNRDNKFFYGNAKLMFVSEDNHSVVIELKKEPSKSSKEKFDDRIGLSEKFTIDNKLVVDNSEEDNILRSFTFKKRKITYKNGISALLAGLGYIPLDPLFIKFHLPEKLECIDLPGTLTANREDKFIYWDYPITLTFLHDIFSELEGFYDEDLSRYEKTSTEDILKNLKLQEDILENIKFYTPIEDVKFNKNINLYKNEKSIIIENIKLEFKVNGNWLPWSQLSDGTKRLFYIISEITFTDGLILIEEPELGIHPHQFNLLMNFLKEQSEHKQIVVSTHSPKALDHLSQDELDSILITYYDLKKGTQIRHLTSKEVGKAKRYMKEVGFFSDYWLLSDLEE